MPNPTTFLSKLMTRDHDARTAAPSDVWDYRAYSTWRDEVWKLISDFADAEVRSEFVAAPPEFVVCDDLSWLDDIVYKIHGIEIDSKRSLEHQLRKRYRAMRAVHGTRTADLDRFYKEGLQPLVPEHFHTDARRVFLSGDFPELSESDIQSAIAKVGADLREGRVFFEANEEMLIEQSGHYMLYGSEYLLAIAANIGNRRDYRQVLKTRGIPTLFVCDVPLDLISAGTLLEFSGDALANVFQELIDGSDFQPDRWRGAGFCIRGPLGPEHLVGHYHPVVRRDPHARW